MHLYVMARGVKDSLDRWVNDLLSRYLPYQHLKGEPKALVQLSVRPVQLYEIVFPEDQLDEVLKLVRPSPCSNKDMGHIKNPRYKIYNQFIKFFAKLLGLKPVPKWTDDEIFRIYHGAVAVHGIGIKKDVYVDGIEQL